MTRSQKAIIITQVCSACLCFPFWNCSQESAFGLLIIVIWWLSNILGILIAFGLLMCVGILSGGMFIQVDVWDGALVFLFLIGIPTAISVFISVNLASNESVRIEEVEKNEYKI